MRLAAIDIGSNSILLTIVEGSSPHDFRILHDEAVVVGLSKGLQADNKIQPEKTAKAAAVLSRYAELCRSHQVESISAAATEALRRAANGTEVKAVLENALGQSIQLISGDREADLSFWSVQKSSEEKTRLKLVFDIGGASSELCLGDHHGIRSRVSLKVGSVMLSERFGLTKPCHTADAIHYCQKLIAENGLPKNEVREALGIGVAGTITTLFALEKKLKVYARDQVHGQTMTTPQLFAWLQKLSALTPEGRSQFPGLPLDRADVIVGGLSIAYALADYYGWERILCLDLGIRFGLLFEKIANENNDLGPPAAAPREID